MLIGAFIFVKEKVEGKELADRLLLLMKSYNLMCLIATFLISYTRCVLECSFVVFMF